jgi:hypothetical protein
MPVIREGAHIAAVWIEVHWEIARSEIPISTYNHRVIT